ncbi:hypothetical protein MC885_021838 [Smutsia gigantea]|nr:hypothetical protein MC885_021838 [Smutsia gigantea]
MDLQRPDSYQWGADPDFSEHVLHKHAPCFHPPILRQEKQTLRAASETVDHSSFANWQSTQTMHFSSWEQPPASLPSANHGVRELQASCKLQIWKS